MAFSTGVWPLMKMDGVTIILTPSWTLHFVTIFELSSVLLIVFLSCDWTRSKLFIFMNIRDGFFASGFT